MTTSPTNDNPAQLLRLFRQRLGVTQAEAADWWGCSESHWQQMESGQRNVPRPLAKRMAALAHGRESHEG